jgi:diguanylate cyclase (GGDEF)-like protein/PAS domain S-box-containing protein
MAPPLPENEEQRLAALQDYLILDILSDSVFARYAGLVGRLFGTGISAISLVDRNRQLVKASQGLEIREIPRGLSFCAHTILSSHVLVVPDARRDSRFQEFPLVKEPPRVRFYAGAPLRSRDGFNLGTLCLMDTTPRELDAGEIVALQDLAGMVMDEIDFRLENARIASAEEGYRELFENATDIVYTHDLRGAITSINKAMERVTGYSRDEALRMNILDMLDPASRELASEMIRQQLGGSPQATYELTLVTKDDRRVALEAGTRLLFRRGLPAGIQGIARDITERKKAEMLERDCNHVLELVAGNEPLDNVLAKLCRLVERQYAESACSVLLRREGRLFLAAAPSLPQEYAEAWQRPEVELASGPFEVCAPRQAVAEFDIASEPALSACRDLLLGLGMKTCRSFLILSGEGSPLGVFVLFCRDRHEPGPAELEALETARRLAAVAVEQRQLTDLLAYQALHDALTGLPNRVLFEQRLEHALAGAGRHNWLLAVLFIDLDRFKQVNDTLGHSAGDWVLKQVSRRLESCLRKSDSLARMGGDEFTLILTELNDPQDAQRVARKLLDAFQSPFQAEARELFLTGSIGISLYPRDGRDAATLQRKADTAMYRAKSRGKNSFEFYTPELGIAALERLEIENALRRAMDNGEMQLYYQPQAAMSGKLAGFEALLVWMHPRLGVIPPAQFIPVAEESGMIFPIGAWALTEACRQNAAWQRSGSSRLKVAVNVSPMQFARADFVETVAQALAHSGLEPALLELELTENVVVRDLEESARQMDRLRALGVGISIDDFGTGYSSLSYLRHLPIDTLKIDQSFLKELGSESSTVPLVQAIVTLAHGLGLTVVAEGVENHRQLEALRSVGCDMFQGYLLGEPLPAEAAGRLLATGDLSSLLETSG